MADMLDYIAWRGDLSFERDGFNEADAAVLARFSYIPFEYFTEPLTGFTTVREIAERAMRDEKLWKEGRWKLEDDRLLTAMAGSNRFSELAVGYPADRFNEALQEQFFAVTIRLGDGLSYVAFRGTDNTIVGWKEDMNMSFLCPIPGQKTAVDYVNFISDVTDSRLILGGHSKGGNLAVFAGAFCHGEARERIEAVYNFDGPGFFDNILKTEGYQLILPKIHTFVPQFSIVGMLLGREEESSVVLSVESGLSQHDIYSWQILGSTFEKCGRVTGGSRFVDSALKGWIAEMTPEQFECFADTIYRIMIETNARTLHEMRENWFDSARSILRSIGGIDENTRQAVIESLKILFRNAGREVKENIAR